MSTRMHTPGPWSVRCPSGDALGPNDSCEVFTEAPGVGISTSHHGFRTIAICSHRDRRFPAYPERLANARLIAGAPEMYDDLGKAADTFHDLMLYFKMLGKVEMRVACEISENALRERLAKIDGAA